MSLSTSSSDSRPWGRWLATFVCMSALGACMTFALVILWSIRMTVAASA